MSASQNELGNTSQTGLKKVKRWPPELHPSGPHRASRWPSRCSAGYSWARASSNKQRLSIIVLQVAVIGIIAVGVTQVIITGGVDLSSGSMVGFIAMVAASFAQTSANARAVFLRPLHAPPSVAGGAALEGGGAGL
jgi:inositol transport system permease protein